VAARLYRFAIFALAIAAGLAPSELAGAQPLDAPDAKRAALAWLSALSSGDRAAATAGLRPGGRFQWSREPEQLERARAAYRPLAHAETLPLAARREWAALLPPAGSVSPPVLLHREDGAWRIDWIEVLKSYLPDPTHTPLANPENPYRWLVPPPQRAEGFPMDEVDLLGEPLDVAIARLERAHEPAARQRLAEILWRNCWLVDASLDAFERVAAADRASFQPTERFAWVAWAVGEPDRAVALAERWQPASYDLLARLHARAGRYPISQEYRKKAIREHVQSLRKETGARATSPKVES
jgi:hypothetical protein